MVSVGMAKEESEKPGGFREVRDLRGRLLFRILPNGILEIKVREDRILVNLWDYLEPPPRQNEG